MSARILIVEDDPALVGVLRSSVRSGGFEEEAVGSGREAIQALRQGSFDAILLDLGLPDMTGGDLLRALREVTDTPILVVSGRDGERVRVESLDAGADDYVAKPFLSGELNARIRAAIRRQGPAGRLPSAPTGNEGAVRLGALLLEPGRRRVSCGDERVELSESETKILKCLMERGGEIVSKSDLLEVLYGEQVRDTTRIVEVYVSSIRRKIAVADCDAEILNFRSRGWRLVVSD